MGRLNFILLIAVLASGLMLVRSAYEARRLFTAVDRAQAETRRLEADSERLQAERHAQATNLRVEKVARERLQMHGITPAYSQQVEDQGVVAKARTVAASGVRP
ncbi:cell division protein FtsL [Paucibacter sp. DJ2R-2]|uniref:cell division protein FtsL n=1 Tax=Paucibacter sp. DJ2R-2 TaxID=2893558 RepID=UPI0021E384F3|nr:cell division protein FtsL [Paucibacter sp. DJ2R-2]MCV2421821.1 cell division protein FtsL [Paucibacter sp. DJ4R-1]MCV2439562.1 cell division protein FtsL [Paucibacter sp. DJ2R-2]